MARTTEELFAGGILRQMKVQAHGTSLHPDWWLGFASVYGWLIPVVIESTKNLLTIQPILRAVGDVEQVSSNGLSQHGR